MYIQYKGGREESKEQEVNNMSAETAHILLATLIVINSIAIFRSKRRVEKLQEGLEQLKWIREIRK